MPVLQVTDVAVHFGGVKAVDGVTIELTEGKIFGIVGPNGSGKSTLLAAISRLVPLKQGQLALFGTGYEHARPAQVARLGVSRTFQTVRVVPELSVLENVQLGADLHGSFMRRKGAMPTSTALGAEDAVAVALRRTGLQQYAGRHPEELSYGLQRRVEVARALASQPRLLILDEPTAGMNSGERAAVAVLLKELRAAGLTQLLVEHDVQMMTSTCDWLFAMNFGRLIAQGPPEHVVRDPAVREAYLGKNWRSHAASN